MKFYVLFTIFNFFSNAFSYFPSKCVFKPVLKVNHDVISVYENNIYILSKDSSEYNFFKNKLALNGIFFLPPPLKSDYFAFNNLSYKLAVSDRQKYAISDNNVFINSDESWKLLINRFDSVDYNNKFLYVAKKSKIFVFRGKSVVKKVELPVTGRLNLIKINENHIVFTDDYGFHESFNQGKTWRNYEHYGKILKIVLSDRRCYFKTDHGVKTCTNKKIDPTIVNVWKINDQIVFLKKSNLVFENSPNKKICSLPFDNLSNVKLFSLNYIHTKGYLFKILYKTEKFKTYRYLSEQKTNPKSDDSSNLYSSFLPEVSLVFERLKADNFFEKYNRKSVKYAFYMTFNWNMKSSNYEKTKAYKTVFSMYDF